MGRNLTKKTFVVVIVFSMVVTMSPKSTALVLLIPERVLFIEDNTLCDLTVVVDPLVPFRCVRFQPTQQRFLVVSTVFAGDCGKTFTDASVYFFLEDPDCNTGEIIGNLAVFADQIWATKSIVDFLALRLTSA